MKIKLISALVAVSVLSGCAGRKANPINAFRLGDNELSRQSIEKEMTEINSNIQRLLPESQKTTKNVALGIGGLFFFPAWFFMDFSDAERQEIDAYKTRYNHLHRIHSDKYYKRR